jgi:hypothetical protein
MQTKILKEKEAIKNLGKNLKLLVNEANDYQEGEYFGIQFIKPKDKDKTFIAKPYNSVHYVVLMHFNENIRDKVKMKSH